MRKLLRFLLLLPLAACLRAPKPETAAAMIDYPIIPAELPPGIYGNTECSWNNKPFIKISIDALVSNMAPIAIAHEYQHAKDAEANKGGCWPFMYRAKSDSAFLRKMEYRAYCAEGREAIKQNRNPVDAWSRIKSAMLQYGDTLVEGQNCLFDSWPSQYKALNTPKSPGDTLRR